MLILKRYDQKLNMTAAELGEYSSLWLQLFMTKLSQRGQQGSNDAHDDKAGNSL